MNGKTAPMPSMDTGGETDVLLMKLIGQGDMAAFGELYIKYGKFVDHAILGTVPTLSRPEVEDLCQDVFLSIQKSAAKYREEGKLKSWIFSCAVKTTREYRRKWTIRGRLLDMLKGKRVAISRTELASPDVGAMMRLDIGKILQQLPEIQRRVLILYEQEELKGDEIAALLGMNPNTVWTHLRRAKAAVNQQLKPAKLYGGGAG